MKKDEISTSWVGRSLRTAGSFASFGMRSLGRPSPDGHAAEALAAALGRLKGLAMKAGQMMSYVDSALPPAARNALATLQDSVPPMSPEVIDSVVAGELGAAPRDIFATWAAQPIAAASIGQVHLATLRDGTEVAVKVQYPAIAKALDADLKSASLLASLAGLTMRGVNVDDVVAEMKERLREECDYQKEAANQEEFRRHYAGDPAILVPEVYPRHSSARVLTTRYVRAGRFADFERFPTPVRNQAAETIFRFAFESIFRHHLFNCDPHPGNYLFHDDGRVVFLDFGCVKRFEPAFVQRWRDMHVSVLAGDRSRFKELISAAGIVGNPRGFDYDYHFELSRQLYKPVLEDRPFKYTEDYIHETNAILIDRNPNKRKTNLPKDYVFVNRLQWGLSSILARLGAEANWHRIVAPYIFEHGRGSRAADAAQRAHGT